MTRGSRVRLKAPPAQLRHAAGQPRLGDVLPGPHRPEDILFLRDHLSWPAGEEHEQIESSCRLTWTERSPREIMLSIGSTRQSPRRNAEEKVRPPAGSTGRHYSATGPHPGMPRIRATPP